MVSNCPIGSRKLHWMGIITLISFPFAVKYFNFADNNLLKSGGAQYCSYKIRNATQLISEYDNDIYITIPSVLEKGALAYYTS